MNPEARTYLRKLSIFAGLSDDALDAVAGRTVVRSLPRGRQLFRRGEPCQGLYVVVEGSGDGPSSPLRFSLVDVDRMRYEPGTASPSPWPPLLPAEVDRLLAPFQVVRAFTSKVGLREYVAMRRQRGPKAPPSTRPGSSTG